MTSDLTISEEELEGVRHHLREHGWGEIGDEICALARRSLAPWQPIETAPRDNQRVLVAAHTGSNVVPVPCRFHNDHWHDDHDIPLDDFPITHWMPLPPPPSMAAETEETELGRIVPYSTQRYRATPVATQSEEKEDEGEEAKTQQAQAEGEEAQTEARKPATKEQHRIPGLGSVGSVAPLHIPQAERNDDDPNAEGSETCPQKDEQVQQGQEGVCSPNIGAGQQVAPPPPVERRECEYCNGNGWFYSTPDLGPCVCTSPPPPVERGEFVVWNEPICLKPGFVANSVCRATKADIITAQKGNFPERNYSDQEALADFMAVHGAWFEPFPPSPPPVERGEIEPIPCNLPFERIPQHEYDPGFGPVPPRPKVEPLFPDNTPNQPLPLSSDVGELVERLRRLGQRREMEGIYTDQNICEAAAAKLQEQAEEIERLKLAYDAACEKVNAANRKLVERK